MVTSNKISDKKVVKMTEQNNIPVVPQRTLLGEVNEQITCSLCRGYYIDATTIVECLHSFCRSCIIKHLQIKSYCPECEMMINSAKPNIKLDKALQDIVYKLVPGLFQREMERRQQFYASRPGPAASATPEQRGEDTERIIFSPEDVISFSLEFIDATDADSISSKSSDSNDQHTGTGVTRRFLQCPAVVNISHLKKFLSMKFDIDSTQFAIDILYKRVSLQDYYTLMDIAYIYNWKRNEPMRFFYQIIDFMAIRNRLFDINRKGSHFRDRKPSLTSTEDPNASSPAQNVNDQGSEASSGTDSPMPDENNVKKSSDTAINNESNSHQTKDDSTLGKNNPDDSKKTDEDVEKSQFLNSFELTAKNCLSPKTSPEKNDVLITPTEKVITKNQQQQQSVLMKNNDNQQQQPVLIKNDDKQQQQPALTKNDDNLKRRHPISPCKQEIKKMKIEMEKSKMIPKANLSANVSNESNLHSETRLKKNDMEASVKSSPVVPKTSVLSFSTKEVKQNILPSKPPDNLNIKRTLSGQQSVSGKRKSVQDMISPAVPQTQPSNCPKTVSPLKLQVPKLDTQTLIPKTEPLKSIVKKMPDLKLGVPSSQTVSHNKPVNKVRMDLLANNSDPTIDRSKILSQVTSSLSSQNVGPTSGDPLKSLFDSCKINIPSSLSITLTDQKLETRNPNEQISSELKNIVNKNLANAGNAGSHKVPSPPVHNYIEILKLPDSDSKKLPSKPDNISENIPEAKTVPSSKIENLVLPTTSKSGNKSSESAKGPVPNLKPISDTKLAKQSGNGNFASPITFQQTFEKQLQSLQSDKKTKLAKTKSQVPKLVPATPKAISVANKLNNSNKTTSFGLTTPDNKCSSALDLSSPHSIHGQLGAQQTKAFETMQSIANLAKKQNLPSRVPSNQPSNMFGNVSNGPSPLRVPTSSISQTKREQTTLGGTQSNTLRQDNISSRINQIKQPSNLHTTVPSSNYQTAAPISVNTTHPSPRSQTRSPSSSPKLVIAEEKQSSTSSIDQSINQSNQISSTQQSHNNLHTTKSESPKASPGPSKPGHKPIKSFMSPGKSTGIRPPIIPNMKSNTAMNTPNDSHYLPQTQLISAHEILRQMEIRNVWLKQASQYISNIHQSNQNDFSNKDKQ